MFAKIVVVVSAGFLLLPGVATAQDINEGHHLARNWCSACHAVEDVVLGPVQDAAPSFLSIARMLSTTEMSLTVFLVTPHPTMPNYSLTRKEIRDVIAYILMLKEDGSKAINTKAVVPPNAR